MLHRLRGASLGCLSPLLFMLVACGSDDRTPGGTSGSTGVPGDPLEFAVPPRSCAYDCSVTDACAERGSAYACPSLDAWSKIPHAETCPAWDGKPPAAKQGQCVATTPSGEAAKYTGVDPDNPAVTIRPGGARSRPAGRAWIFSEPEVLGGMTSGIAPIPDTSLVLTVDTSALDHVVRLVDTARLAAGQDPVTSRVVFPRPATLNWGVAFAGPDRAYVATNDGVIQAFSVDIAAKTVSRDDARSIVLPPGKGPTGAAGPWFASGVAVSADGMRLATSSVREKRLLVFNVDPASAMYGATLGEAELGARETFGVSFDRNDPMGQYVYVSLWNDRGVAEVDLLAPGGPAKTRVFSTGKAPGGVAFLDGRWMVVANGLGDGLTLVDRVSGTTHEVPVDPSAERGLEPTTLDYDAVSKRLYVALSGVSAVAAYSVDTAMNPPSLSPIGRIPTLWWPSGVVVQGDGGLVVTSLRGDGGEPEDDPEATGAQVYERTESGVQHVPLLSEGAIAALDASFQKDADVGALPGHPVIDCPAGVRDFPIPATNEEGPSPVLEHIFIVIRENKTFDALLGDYPGVNGDPKLTLKPSGEDMARIWTNLRSLAGRFVVSDNFYTAAEISILGHTWTVYGRSTDFSERTWTQSGYGRADMRVATEIGGIYDVGRPEEGGLFDWLANAGIPHDILGENQGLPEVSLPGRSALDFNYPGGFVASVAWPDNEKACYVAGRARVRCDLGKVVLMTLPNDHALGVTPGKPLPEVMIAVNDEATGMVVDAISHSPLWPSSLVFVLEDDTAQGGDHVDAHRTLLLVASPWVKKGYTSKTNIDVSSIHKIIAHVYGLPYPNVQVARAGLPLDMFTSTPDFEPFTYTPRKEPLACTEGSGGKEASEGWDVSGVDRSPGLDHEVTRWLQRGGAKAQ